MATAPSSGRSRARRSACRAKYLESMDRRFDGGIGGLPESTDRRVIHVGSDVVHESNLVIHGAARLILDDAVQRLFLPDGPHTTGHALAAGLFAEERGGAHHDRLHVAHF